MVGGHSYGGRSSVGASVFRDITNQSIYGDSIKKRLYNSTKGKHIFLSQFLF